MAMFDHRRSGHGAMRNLILLVVLSPIAHQTNFSYTEAPYTTNTPPPTVFRNTQLGSTPKPRRVKAESVMLNHIFDSYATNNKHFHDRLRPPSFDGDMASDDVIEADTGATVTFNCRVTSLRDKRVSWLKVTDDENLKLLTLDLETHSADSRYRVDLAGENWRLALRNANVEDSGVYCCHVSTHPPLLRHVKLTVYPPEIRLTKEAFLETSETLSMKCMILHLHPGDVIPVLHWYRGNSTVPLDEIRGGVLVESDLINITSHLQVARLKMDDAGMYTCALEAPLRMKAVARVHVLQGSSLAELQSGVKTTTSYLSLLLSAVLLVFGSYGGVR